MNPLKLLPPWPLLLGLIAGLLFALSAGEHSDARDENALSALRDGCRPGGAALPSGSLTPAQPSLKPDARPIKLTLKPEALNPVLPH